MSPSGQTTTSPAALSCQLPPAADKPLRMLLPAVCHKETYAAQQIALLFDHLIGAGEQRRRNGEPERLSGRQVNDEVKLGRLLDR
jgi:hypothetical protein